jgi:hypothetical protein
MGLLTEAQDGDMGGLSFPYPPRRVLSYLGILLSSQHCLWRSWTVGVG